MFHKIRVLKNFTKIHRKIPAVITFFNRFQPGGLQRYQKKDADFKNTYFYRTPPVAAWRNFILIEIYAVKVNRCVIAPTSKNLKANKLVKTVVLF